MAIPHVVMLRKIVTLPQPARKILLASCDDGCNGELHGFDASGIMLKGTKKISERHRLSRFSTELGFMS